MPPKQLSSAFSVAAQIQIEDLAQLKNLGFNSILINRPDGEGADQPPSSAVIAAAQALDLQAAYVPYRPGQNPLEILPKFEAAMAEMTAPTLAYCLSGTRAVTLWTLSQQGKASQEAG